MNKDRMIDFLSPKSLVTLQFIKNFENIRILSIKGIQKNK